MSGEKFLHVGPGIDLPLSVVTSKAAILAMTGMGKTFLAKAIAEEMLNHGVQIVVGDYTGVWWGLTSSASGKREGKNVVVFGGDHADVGINENAGALIADLVVNERVSAVLDVSGFEDDAPKIRFMTAFAKRLYFKNKKAIHFFLDEADEFVPQNPQRDQIAMLSVIKRIWQRGRIKGIGGTLISQRSAVVNKSLLSQSEILIALRTVAPQDRKALAAWFESWGTVEQIDTFEKTISNLQDHHAWFWSPRHKLFVQGKARALETFDSGATPDVEHGLDIIEPTKRTAHDIAKFGKQIEKLAEDAASEDPELLKKQAKHYREQFEIGKERILILEKRLDKREKKNTTTIVRDKPVKVPALSPKTLKEIKATRKALGATVTALSAALRDAATAIADDAESVIKRLDHELGRAESIARLGFVAASSPFDPVKADMDGAAATRMLEEVTAFEDKRETWRPARQAPAGGTNGDGGGGLTTGGKRRILAALAQHGSMKPGRIRVLAAISTTNTLNTYIRALTREELIWKVSGGNFEITPRGKIVLGEYEPLPTGAALISFWRKELGPGGMGKIFGVLLANARNSVPDAQLMDGAGISSVNTFNTYVRKLKALGLAEGRNNWTMLASEFHGI